MTEESKKVKAKNLAFVLPAGTKVCYSYKRQFFHAKLARHTPILMDTDESRVIEVTDIEKE